MKSYLVETSVIIDYLRGRKNAVDLLNGIKGELTSSYICLSELYEGIYRVKSKEAHEESLRIFFNSLDSIYGIDGEIARKFGELRAFLKQKGKAIEDLDLLIAATCIVNDLELITFNMKHFSRIADLKIYQKD